MNPILALLKKQPARILSYIAAGFLLGNWVGVNYSAQSIAFWAQPIVALCMAIATVMATTKSNKEQVIREVVAKFSEPPSAPSPKEPAIRSQDAEKARVEAPK